MKINLEVKKHDKYQLQFDYTYNLTDEKITKTEIEMNLFAPNSLGINKLTYPKSTYYSRLKNYIRYRAEKLPLSSLSGYFTLIENIYNTKEDIRYYERVKIFAVTFQNGVREIFKPEIIEKMKKEEINLDLIVDNIGRILKRFREKIVFNSRYKRTLYTDEYLSFSLRQKLLKFIDRIERVEGNLLAGKLKELVDQEELHIEKMGYVMLTSSKNPQKLGKIMHNYRMMRKYIHAPLFLRDDRRETGGATKQFTSTMSAGLAMVFATIVTFYTQLKYGTHTTEFFIAALIGYMFKDRIKDLGKSFTYDKLRRNQFDYKNIIYNQNGKKLLNILEQFRIVEEKSIDKEIRNLKNRNSPIKEFDDRVILYKKQLKVLKSREKSENRRIRDIHYLGLIDFCRKMDDPDEILYHRKNGRVKKLISRKLYVVNVFFKIRDEDGERNKFYKIYLDRNGINEIKEY